uniref:Uncharacterized protein n=1 Tax=Pyrodinium bahamense TaxID=73915 RepID=A0A7R9ZZV4_9DINO
MAAVPVRKQHGRRRVLAVAGAAGRARHLAALLALGTAATSPLAAEGAPCVPGEPVAAFFAGQVDLGGGSGITTCTPEMEQCYFPGRIHSGPDAEGIFDINWDDGDTTNRRVHHSHTRRGDTAQPCDGPVPPPSEEDEDWVPPEIPCTILPRLHWEGSDPEWNKEAIESLRNEYQPDEVIDGFDWHVILRFNDVNRCEAAYSSLDSALQKCTEPDPEKCRTHKYVKAVEYVGDDPDTRRRTGRQHHNADPRQQPPPRPTGGRAEL